jgi:hypothetical protein
MPAPDPYRRTHERFRAAAKDGHAWIALDGQAIRVTLPVHPEEWSRAKAEFLKDAAEQLVKVWTGKAEKVDEEAKRTLVTVIRNLAGTPLSYLDKGNTVEFVVGRPDVPGILRLDLRSQYDPGLERVVVDTLKTDFDRAAAESLLGRAPAPPPVAAALKTGLPEAPVGVLLRWAKTGDDAQKQAAVRYLQSWGETWNRDHGVPEAPAQQPQAKYLTAWEHWYAEMKQFPLPLEKVPLTPVDGKGGK